MLSTSLLLAGALAGLTLPMDRITGRAFATRSEVIARHGMAATSQPLATQVALDILKRGGNAIDAAIAANALLGLVEPTGCGIGGDLFAIVWDAEKGELVGLNASGRSPASLELAEFERWGLSRVPKRGPLPVSGPRLRRRLVRAARRASASCRWPKVLAPASSATRTGRRTDLGVDRVLLGASNAERTERPFPTASAEVFEPEGRTPEQGRGVQEPGAWRDTLERPSRRVAATRFYRRRHRRAGSSDLHASAQGGFLTYERHGRPSARSGCEPVSLDYRGYDRLGAPAQRTRNRGASDPGHPRGLRRAPPWASEVPSTSTPSSRPRSSPSRIARASTRTRDFHSTFPVQRSSSPRSTRAERRASDVDPERAAKSYPAEQPGARGGRHGLPDRRRRCRATWCR